MEQAATQGKVTPSEYEEFRYGWKVVLAALMGVGLGVTGMNTYSLGVFLDPLSTEFGWTRAEASASKTFLTLGYVLTAPLIGHLVDKFGPRSIGITSMILLVFAFLCMTLINGDIRFYFAAYFLLALAGCATTPLVWTRGVATWFHKKRGLAMGLTLTGSGLAGFITPLYIGTLIDNYGWEAGYIGMSVMAALALIPIFFFFFENKADETNEDGSAKPFIPQSGLEVGETLKSRRFWQIAIGFMLIGGAVSALIIHLVPLLSGSGLDRNAALTFAGLLGVFVIASRLLTGYLVDHFHPPYVAGVFLILPAIGCALLATGALSTPFVIIAAATFGLAAGAEVDLIPYLTARYFGLKSYGKIYGWMFVFFYSGVGLGPLFLGHMYDLHGNYNLGLAYTVPVLFIGAALVGTLGKAPEFK